MNTIAKSWTKKDLKNGYGITYPTLLKWLLKIPALLRNMTVDELKNAKRFTPAQSQIIIDHIGEVSNS